MASSFAHAPVLLLALFACACGSSEPVDAPKEEPTTPRPPSEGCGLVESGTRLKAKRWVTEDGAWEDLTRHRVWYDSLLDTDCQVRLASDGMARCLPLVVSTGSYTDSACSEPVINGPSPCEASPPRYFLEAIRTLCSPLRLGDAYVVHRVGPTTVPTTIYRREDDGTCAEAGEGGHTVYTSAGVVPVSDFVAATIVESTDSRLVHRHFVTDDGARGGGLDTYPFDSVLGELCVFDGLERAADGSQRCLPFHPTAGGSFRDAACSQMTVPNDASVCGDRARFAAVEEKDTCPGFPGAVSGSPTRLHFHELGEEFTTQATYWLDYSDTDELVCTTVDLGEPRDYAVVGAEVRPSTFVGATERELACGPLGASGQRLRAIHWVSDEGHPAETGEHWFDSELKEACSFRLAADGVPRCLPQAQPVDVGDFAQFSDARCTQMVTFQYPCHDSSKYGIAAIGGAGECIDEPRHHVYSLGKAFKPTALYRGRPSPDGTGRECVPYEGSLEELTEQFAFRPIGSELPPTRFLAGTEETF